MSDDWKDILAGVLVTTALLLILTGIGAGLIHLARSTPWL